MFRNLGPDPTSENSRKGRVCKSSPPLPLAGCPPQRSDPMPNGRVYPKWLDRSLLRFSGLE